MKARLLLAGFLCVIGAAAIAAAPASTVTVERPWIRWLPANLPAAGYATLANAGGHVIRLTSASSATFGSVTLMRSRLDQNDSTMVTVTHIDVPAHGNAALAPGGYHLMLSQPVHPIQPGDTVPITLHFADGAVIHADFPVLPASASGP